MFRFFVTGPELDSANVPKTWNPVCRVFRLNGIYPAPGSSSVPFERHTVRIVFRFAERTQTGPKNQVIGQCHVQGHSDSNNAGCYNSIGRRLGPSPSPNTRDLASCPS